MERLRDLIGFLKDAADTAEERIEAVLEEHDGAKAMERADGAEASDLLEYDAHGLAESVATVESILVEAVGARASDVHFENELQGVRIRIRVDGDLRLLAEHDVDKQQLERIVRVLKVRSGMDISQHRRAQSGRFSAVVDGHTWFVRAQTQPTVRGENVILRLLPEGSSLLHSIADLGFSSHAEERYRRLLANPGGLVLVVGPTGSGKTTTLYAGLKALSVDETRKVISIEDPVEFGCEGVQQVEVNREAHFAFADAMRAFVRQDPDVILLGEIRDTESALEAIRASQTGHLVLTTLHCNDAVDAVQRLLDLGMHANSVSSELLAVFAQRLAKRICPECREACAPDPDVAAEVFPDGAPEGFECFRGRGCEACDGTGYRGRIAVVEYLPMNARLRNVIAHGATLEELRGAARESGIVSLRDRSLELVQDGTIAFENLPRFIPIDRLSPSVDTTS
jgi:type IV pilus assembly protein PilB